MIQSKNTASSASRLDRGELFSMLLRLHPIEPGQVSPSSGNQVQAAFLDMVRQGDPALADWLHAPNQRRPYTLGLLQGFNHLPIGQLEEMRAKNQMVQVMPGQVYWLRITMLDATVFGSFVQCLLTKARSLTIRLGDARFEISRLLSTPDPDNTAQPWVAYSSFSELRTLHAAQKLYHFEFATPTAFSMGQKPWGKLLSPQWWQRRRRCHSPKSVPFSLEWTHQAVPGWYFA